MRILLSGASGTLGRYLTMAFLEDGHQIYALMHRKESMVGPVTYVKGDVTLSSFGIQGPVPKVDAILNAAGLVSFANSARSALEQVNAVGALNAAELARGLGIPFFHISTAYVCGDHKGVFTANDLDLGQNHRNEYERSKFQAELVIRAEQDLTWTIFRPSILVGDSKVSGIPPLHGLYLGVRGVYLTKRWLERKLALPALDPELRIRADPCATMNLIPVDIAARQIADLILKSEPGTYPIINTQPPTITEICAGASAALGAKIIPCLAFEPNPGERMLERLVRDLLPYLQGEPVFAANPACPSPASQVIPPGFVEQTARLFLLNHSGPKR